MATSPNLPSLSILAAAIETSTTSTMTHEADGVVILNALTVKKPSRLRKIFK